MANLLEIEQKQFCLQIDQDIMDCANNYPNFQNTILTGDKSRIYEYDPETKVQ